MTNEDVQEHLSQAVQTLKDGGVWNDLGSYALVCLLRKPGSETVNACLRFSVAGDLGGELVTALKESMDEIHTESCDEYTAALALGDN